MATATQVNPSLGPLLAGYDSAGGRTNIAIDVTNVTIDAFGVAHGQLLVTGGGGGVQYLDGSATPAHATGTIPVFDNAGVITQVSAANPLPVSATVTPSANQRVNAHLADFVDGWDATQGLSTDADTVASVMGRLTKIKNLLGGTLVVDGHATTQPISAASLPLPTGAALEAGNLATIVGLLDSGQENMAGSLSVAIASDQSPVPVSGTFWQATQPVSGVFWQSTQPVSAASLPLPTGASTAAKQPALGTAGTASADVLSIQGIASMTPVKVDGSGVTQPVSIATLPALAAGSAVIGHVIADSGSTTAVTSLPAIPTGANTIGNVGIVAGTAVIGHVISDTGSVVQANAGTNLNTSALALETGGNLATLAGAVSSTRMQANVAQINGVAPSMGNGVSGTGVQRVTLASDSTGQVALAASTAVIGHVIVDSGGGGGTQYTDAGTPPTNPIGGAIIYDNSGAWVDAGIDAPLPVKFVAAQHVIVDSGGGSNASVGTDGSAIPTSSTLIGASDGTNLQQLLVESSSNRNLRVGLYNGANEAAIDSNGFQAIKGGSVEQAGLSAGSLNADLVASTDVSAYRWWSLHILTVASGGVLTFQGSNDNTNWISVNAFNAGTNTAAVQTTSTATIYYGSCTYRYLRIRQTSWTSGSTTGVLELYATPGTGITTTAPMTQSGNWSVRAQDGSGTALTSTSNALDVNIKSGSVTQGAGAAAGTNWRVSGDFTEVAGQGTGVVNASGTDLIPSTDVSAYKSFSLQTSGTWNATFIVQGSNDNATFSNVYFNNIIGNTAAISSFTSNGTYQGSLGFRYLRVRASAFTSNASLVGTLELYASPVTPLPFASVIARLDAFGTLISAGQTTMSLSLPVAIASNQSAVPASQSGTWTIQPGNTQNTTPWSTTIGPTNVGTQSDQSATGTNATVTATMNAVSAKTNYLSGYVITGLPATALSSGDVTISGLQNTLTAEFSESTTGGGELIVMYNPPRAASAANTAISVSVAALGASSAKVAVNTSGFYV
jgi:hypothetical protein